MEDRSKGHSQGKKYDPHFTDSVIAATGKGANPRLKQIMPALLRHLHDFAREVDLTVAEWTAGVEMVSSMPTISGSSGPFVAPVRCKDRRLFPSSVRT